MAKLVFLVFILLHTMPSAVFSGDNIWVEAVNPVDFKVPKVKLSVGATSIARKMLKNPDPQPEPEKEVCDDHDVDCVKNMCDHVKTSTGEGCACESEYDNGNTLSVVFCIPTDLEDSSGDFNSSSDDSSDDSTNEE